MSRTAQIGLGFIVLAILAAGVLLVSIIGRHVAAAYHVARGARLAREDRLDDAAAEERVAIGLDPRSAAAHNNLGFYLYKKGRFAEAEAECRTSVRLDPSDSHAHDSLGQVLSHTGRSDEAVQECRLAVRQRPSAIHLNSLAYALGQEGQWEEARRDWQQVTAMSDSAAASEAQRMLAQSRR